MAATSYMAAMSWKSNRKKSSGPALFYGEPKKRTTERKADTCVRRSSFGMSREEIDAMTERGRSYLDKVFGSL